MIKNSAVFAILVLFTLTWSGINGQSSFYNLNSIQKIEIHFNESNWDYILDTSKMGSGNYFMCQWLKINGVQFDSVGVKYKGSSSYDSSFNKNPFHISLSKFKDQNYQGISSIKLANGYSDPSMIREVLAYNILQNYMDCPQSNFAQVYVNDSYIGLFSNDEPINKKFCSDHFNSSQNTLIKCSPELPGPYVKSNLKYINADSSQYFSRYEMESEIGWNELVDLCYSITNEQSAIDSKIDIDRALWMIAFNDVLVNLDSYSGWFSQNHYLYKDNTNHFKSIVWDLNMSFGAFPFAGTQNGGSGSLNITNMQQLSPLLHANDSDWPLIQALLSNPQHKKMYIAHMRTITNEIFHSGFYLSLSEQLQTLIDTAVLSDQNKFFTYEQFQNGLTGDVQVSSYTIPGISNLMSARTTYLLSSEQFNDEPPEIIAIEPGSSSPGLGSTVIMLATLANVIPDGVFLGIRFDQSAQFAQVQMYDDGLHNDGAAGDFVFGNSFEMAGYQAQYYIYAENDLAGIFSPENAGHGFYRLFADVATPAPGEVVINEFLAKNTSGAVNELGNYEDWIELYNNTEIPLELYGLYITDSYNDPEKFAFPENTIIQPQSYLTFWADEEESTPTSIHLNFKLSAGGEELMISTGDAGQVIDSITYGAQQSDISLGRCPNGTGNFDFINSPTFNVSNTCGTGVEDPLYQPVMVFPNPTSAEIFVQNAEEKPLNIELINIYNEIIISKLSDLCIIKLNVSVLEDGIYFIKIQDKSRNLTSVQKVMIAK